MGFPSVLEWVAISFSIIILGYCNSDVILSSVSTLILIVAITENMKLHRFNGRISLKVFTKLWLSIFQSHIPIFLKDFAEILLKFSKVIYSLINYHKLIIKFCIY